MKNGIEVIERGTRHLEEFAEFLANFEDDPHETDYWRQRLAFWWDKNPYKPDGLPCGWAAWHEGRVVGFLAALHFEYMFRGNSYPAINAGTWRVLKAHRSMSLPMMVAWHRLRDRAILIDTTPNSVVVKVLERFNFVARKTVHNYFIPLRRENRGLSRLAYGAANLLARWTLPQLPLRMVSITDAFTVLNEFADSERLQKRITREYLEWYCSWPPKVFIGCVDKDNALTSYLIAQPANHGKRNVLSIIDYYTIWPDNGELLALVRYLVSDPGPVSLHGDFEFLMLSSLEDDFEGAGLRIAVHRDNPSNHYYHLPKELRDVPKRCVLAEGDYGC